jgi:hypothetical protein
LLLTGVSGIGKSTVLRHYESMFPRNQERGRTEIPFLYVKTPAAPTEKNVAQAALKALGDPAATRGGAEEKTARLQDLLPACKVEMVAFDEFQHVFHARRLSEIRPITDWVKNLVSDLPMGVLFSGLPEAEWVVEMNEQLKRRFSAHLELLPFTMKDNQVCAQMRGLLREYENRLPMTLPTPLHEGNLARRFFVASYGITDYIVKILDGSVSVANRTGVDRLDLPEFAQAFRERIWREVPDELNPFTECSSLRPLDQFGEPFWRSRQPYGRAIPDIEKRRERLFNMKRKLAT